MYLSIYLSPLTIFISTLSLTQSLSLYISPQHISLLASYSLSQSLLLNSPLSHYFTPYLSHSLYLTLYSFYRATTSPISVMTHDKLYHGSDILPLAPILLLQELVWERWGGGGLLLLPSLLYDTIHPHSDHRPHDLIRTTYITCSTSSMPLLGLTISFSGCATPPPPPHKIVYSSVFPYILSLSIFLSPSLQIIA